MATAYGVHMLLIKVHVHGLHYEALSAFGEDRDIAELVLPADLVIGEGLELGCPGILLLLSAYKDSMGPVRHSIAMNIAATMMLSLFLRTQSILSLHQMICSLLISVS